MDYSAYLENFDKEELVYLQGQAKSAQSTFFKFIHRAGIIIAFLLLLLYTIANFTYDPNRIYEEHETPLTTGFVLRLSGIIILMFGVIFSGAYYFAIHSLFKEIKNGKKVVAQVKIKSKKHMPHNDTYHLLLHNNLKKSIEVDANFYNSVNINDEINIEYTPSSEKVLGYH